MRNIKFDTSQYIGHVDFMLFIPFFSRWVQPDTKAYIPVRLKTIRVGSWLTPQRHNFALGVPTRWYLTTLKFGLPPTRKIKFDTSQWNIGCVGSPTQNFHIGHVDFMLFIPFSQWNMGFRPILTLILQKSVCG